MRLRRWVIILVVLLGFLLRIWAAWQLPVDFDEPTYMDAGYKYAQMIQSGDINGIIDYNGNSEHPPMVKITVWVDFFSLGRGAIWDQALFLSRMVSVIFGSLAVLVLALVDPLAAGFMAVQTLVVKYTSQAYLEALPLLAGLLAIFLLKTLVVKSGQVVYIISHCAWDRRCRRNTVISPLFCNSIHNDLEKAYQDWGCIFVLGPLRYYVLYL